MTRTFGERGESGGEVVSVGYWARLRLASKTRFSFALPLLAAGFGPVALWRVEWPGMVDGLKPWKVLSTWADMGAVSHRDRVAYLLKRISRWRIE